MQNKTVYIFVLHLDANSTEFDPESKHPVVSLSVGV